MKLLAFSDLHRKVDAARAIVEASAQADIVIGAGDFATRDQGITDTFDILRHCKAPLLVVHGNHDNPAELAQLCAPEPDVHYLHGQAITLHGATFFGFGGDTHPDGAASKNRSLSEDAAAVGLRPCPDDAILITHTPPYGTADVYKDGTHGGSTAVRDLIAAKQPKLGLCGHIHFAWGTQGTIGTTKIRNLGPAPLWFDL